MGHAWRVQKYCSHCGLYLVTTHLTGRLLITLRTHAIGTKQKPYCTLTVDCSDYHEELEPTPEAFQLNAHDNQRSKGKPYRYLVEKPLRPGPVWVAARGKGLALLLDM